MELTFSERQLAVLLSCQRCQKLAIKLLDVRLTAFHPQFRDESSPVGRSKRIDAVRLRSACRAD